MKRGVKLAALAAALAVLVGAWLLTEKLTLHQAEQAREQAAAEPVDLSVGPEDQVSALSWNYFGDTVSLSRKGDGWVNADDDSCPIDPDAVHPLIEAVSGLYAAGTILDVTDYEQYGLASPELVIMAAAGDDIVTYEVGSPTPNGTYYLRIRGQDEVYLADGTIYAVFSDAQIGDLLALESAPEDIQTLTGLTVETEAGSYALERRGDAEEVWYTDAWPWFLLGREGAVTALDTEKAEQLCQLVSQIALTDCADWNMTDPADYGLDEPQGAAAVTYRDEEGASRSFALQFGAYDGDGDVYVRLEGSRMVYRVSGLTLDGLMYPDFEAMRPLAPAALDWDRMLSAELTLDGETVEMVRAVSTPTEEDEEPEDIYTVGDRSLDGERVAQWLERLYDLPADSRTDSPGRASLFAFTFHQESVLWPEVTVEFRVYDSVHDLCLVNGSEGYLVSRTTAETVARLAREALAEKAE